MALAWVQQTPAVVLDEPTADLDSKAAADIEEPLEEFRRAGTAVLLATADVLLAAQVADRIAILKDGQIVTERGQRQMLGRSMAELYADYVGRRAPTLLSSAASSDIGTSRPL